MPKKNNKLALNSGIQTYQILTNDDEVCIPSLPIRITTMFGAASSIDMFANFCQEIMAVLGTRIRKCLTFCAMSKNWQTY